MFIVREVEIRRLHGRTQLDAGAPRKARDPGADETPLTKVSEVAPEHAVARVTSVFGDSFPYLIAARPPAMVRQVPEDPDHPVHCIMSMAWLSGHQVLTICTIRILPWPTGNSPVDATGGVDQQPGLLVPSNPIQVVRTGSSPKQPFGLIQEYQSLAGPAPTGFPTHWDSSRRRVASFSSTAEGANVATREQVRRRSQRVLSMVGELHKRGYQRLRVSPGWSGSGDALALHGDPGVQHLPTEWGALLLL